MQCRHLIEKTGLHQLHAGLKQLGANNHGEEPAKQEHGKRKPQVHRADVLVIRGKQPARDALSGSVMMITHLVLPP